MHPQAQIKIAHYPRFPEEKKSQHYFKLLVESLAGQFTEFQIFKQPVLPAWPLTRRIPEFKNTSLRAIPSEKYFSHSSIFAGTKKTWHGTAPLRQRPSVFYPWTKSSLPRKILFRRLSPNSPHDGRRNPMLWSFSFSRIRSRGPLKNIEMPLLKSKIYAYTTTNDTWCPEATIEVLKKHAEHESGPAPHDFITTASGRASLTQFIISKT